MLVLFDEKIASCVRLPLLIGKSNLSINGLINKKKMNTFLDSSEKTVKIEPCNQLKKGKGSDPLSKK